MRKHGLIAGSMALALGLYAMSDGLSAERNDVSKSPFYASKVEVTPGGTLMLHPRLPYVEGLADEDYALALNFPNELSLSPLKIQATDKNERIVATSETVREIVADGKSRKELSYKPDLSQAPDGMGLQLCCRNKTGSVYLTAINFTGTFDWTSFRKEIQIPDGTFEAVPLLLKWSTSTTNEGTLSFKSLQIKEADTGKTVFDFRPEKPVVMKLRPKQQDTCWLSTTPAKTGEAHGGGDKLKLMPGKRYVIECQAKGEGIKSLLVPTVKDAMTKKVVYARTLVFDVGSKIALPDKLLWRIEGKDGKVYESGEVQLVAPLPRVAPKTLETSTWICETRVQSESVPVQNLYVDKLHSWGLNAIEPLMTFPAYGEALNEETLSMPVAQEAKRLGMRVRTYLHFMYEGKNPEAYLKDNPQFAAIDPMGRKKTSRGPFVCPTHYLDGRNAWMKHCMEVIKRSTEINKLDGVFYDYELNAAPYRKFMGTRPLAQNDPARQLAPCMCERCRKAFQASVGLDHTPSVEECGSDALYEKWNDFRCRQNIDLWRLTAQAVKSGNPSATFGLYSGAPIPYVRQTYGVDWTMAAPYLDFAMQRYFCPVLTNAPEEFRAALAKGMPEGRTPPKRLFQINAFPYSDQWLFGVDANKTYAELANIKNDIVFMVAEHCSFGWSFTGLWGMDDQLTLPIKEANAMLAKYEDYFVKGEKAGNIVKAVSGDVQTATWRNGGKKATFVFNRSGTPQNVALKMGSQEAKLKVDANDCAVYEWPVD